MALRLAAYLQENAGQSVRYQSDTREWIFTGELEGETIVIPQDELNRYLLSNFTSGAVSGLSS